MNEKYMERGAFMKRTFAFLISLLMLVSLLLSGCQGTENVSGEDMSSVVSDPTAAPEHTDDQATPMPENTEANTNAEETATADPTSVPEQIGQEDEEPFVEPDIDLTRDDLFFFTNSLEGERIYCQNKDGGELTLVLDMPSHNVNRLGDSLFFQSEGEVYEFDLKSRELSKVVDGIVLFYSATENYVFYSQYAWDEAAQEEYPVLNALDRNSKQIYSTAVTFINELSAYGDSVYFANPSKDYTSYSIVKWSPKEDYHQLIAENLNYSAISMGDGVIHFNENGTNTVYDCESGEKMTLGISDEEMVNVFYSDGSYILTAIDNMWKVDFVNVYKDQRPAGSIRIENAQMIDVIDRINDTLFIRAWLSYDRHDENYYYENVSFYKYYTYDLTKNELKEVTTPGENGKLFADGSFPIIDSSTARQPITNSLYNLFVRGYDFEGAEPLCSKTHGAWTNLAEGKIDLALLAAPTDEEQEYLDKNGVAVEMKQYGSDGLVFMGNTANLTENLTLDDVRKIYKGEITNWKELGGPEEEIVVFYRNDQSGSQRLFEKLLFPDGDIPNYEALGFEIFDEMSSIVDEVANEGRAIGYSLLTYVDVVYEHEEVKLFSVEGVEPTIENIALGDYPLATAGYVVINADEPEDSPTRRLYDWFGCELSKEYIRNCGVVPTFID